MVAGVSHGSLLGGWGVHMGPPAGGVGVSHAGMEGFHMGHCWGGGFHIGSWRGGWGFHVVPALGPWRVWRSGGVSHGVPAGRLGVSHGVLAGRFGVSRRLGFHMGRLGFHLGFCRAVGGFLEFAVTLEPPSP